MAECKFLNDFKEYLCDRREFNDTYGSKREPGGKRNP